MLDHFLSPQIISNLTLAQLVEWNIPQETRYAVLFRLTLAAIFGGLLGWERGRADKPADIRTMVLIGTGAAAFTMIGQTLIAQADQEAIIRADPTRVLSYIISGVGFLGAGAILHSKKSIIGLTTAASIWVVAAIGAACGLGEFLIAFFLFAITFITLWTPWVIALAEGTTDEQLNGQLSEKSNSNAKADGGPAPLA